MVERQSSHHPTLLYSRARPASKCPSGIIIIDRQLSASKV